MKDAMIFLKNIKTYVSAKTEKKTSQKCLVTRQLISYRIKNYKMLAKW